MTLDLINRGNDSTADQQSFDQFLVEVRNADALDQTLVDELLHFRPGVSNVSVGVDELPIVIGGLDLVAFLQRNREVHQVEIDICHIQLLERFQQIRPNQVHSMAIAPDFRCNENVFPGNRDGVLRLIEVGHFTILPLDDTFLDFSVDSLTQLGFRVVTGGRVEVTIANVDGILHSANNRSSLEIL